MTPQPKPSAFVVEQTNKFHRKCTDCHFEKDVQCTYWKKHRPVPEQVCDGFLVKGFGDAEKKEWQARTADLWEAMAEEE